MHDSKDPKPPAKMCKGGCNMPEQYCNCKKKEEEKKK